MFWAVLLISIVDIIYENMSLKKKNQKKERNVMILLLTVAILLLVLKEIGIRTPIKILGDMLYPYGKEIFKNK